MLGPHLQTIIHIVAVVFSMATWLGPFAWVALQVVALLGLRGRSQAFSVPALVALVFVAASTYASWRQDSNLWPILLIFVSPLGVLWNLSCILLSDAEAAFKRRLLVLAACVTAGLFAANALFSLVAGGRMRARRAQQEKSSASIVRGLGARVLLGQVQVEVSADQLGVRGVQQKLEADTDAYRACYEAGLRSHPTAAGYFVVGLTIEADGRVGTASVIRSSGATSIEHCIAERMRRLEFMPPSTANSVSISVPLRLDPDAMPSPVDRTRGQEVEP